MTRLIDKEVLLDLQSQIGQNMLPLIVQTFISEGDKYLSMLRGDISRSELQKLSHALKSSAASLGAIQLSQEAQRIDDLLDTEMNASPDSQRLISLLDASLIALRTYLV
ncbi:Hpt domain-containing protein [Echinimonas agarilytica]|uniref:Hpt domain-containing protein n=1 Tax=Echinimonas agarilytica TaxID=1215918 RepID=A0AA41WAG6_9GAMM|nr:Hpt domain-containing protein [Echinimonas agarilytica]MCM2681272.1 Hpt domain-containing protein [Echinimonas agarilytica]